MNSIKNKNFFCSFSGGKDSCLALYKALNAGGICKYLITMYTENANITRSHGISHEIMLAQAKALNIPLIYKNTSWDDYEKNFIASIKDLKSEGIEYGVFGDIDLEAHYEWVEKVCNKVGLIEHEPLWQQSRYDLLDEFLDAGFETVIVSVREKSLDKSFLGKIITKDLVKEFENLGIDIAGENGEYHSLVINGPIFSHKIDFKLTNIQYHSGYYMFTS